MLVNRDAGLLKLASKHGMIDEARLEELVPLLDSGRSAEDILIREVRLSPDQMNQLKTEQNARSIPAEFDGYKIEGVIGKGGMSVVLKAKHQETGQSVALKVLSPSIDDLPTSRERFHREIQSVSRVVHPHIIRCFGSGETNNRPYLALEYMAKGDLLKMMRQSGSAVPEQQALRIILEIAEALCAIRDAEMMHRDIKPENIFLADDGTAKLADLGLSKSADDDTGLTMTGKSVGTPPYMSPEQALGRYDVNIRTDIFSLGSTLYHLLTGQPPFSGGTPQDIMRKVVKEEPVPVDTLRQGLMPGTMAIIKAMMCKDATRRYQDPEQLIGDLRRLAKDGRQFDTSRLQVGQGEQEKEIKTESIVGGIHSGKKQQKRSLWDLLFGWLTPPRKRREQTKRDAG